MSQSSETTATRRCDSLRHSWGLCLGKEFRKFERARIRSDSARKMIPKRLGRWKKVSTTSFLPLAVIAESFELIEGKQDRRVQGSLRDKALIGNDDACES